MIKVHGRQAIDDAQQWVYMTINGEPFAYPAPAALSGAALSAYVAEREAEYAALLADSLEPHPMPSPIPGSVEADLQATDADMARLSEDIYDLLITRGLATKADFSKAVVDAVDARKALREKLWHSR